MFDDKKSEEKKTRKQPVTETKQVFQISDLIDDEQEIPEGTEPLYKRKGKRSLFVVPEKPQKELYVNEETHQARKDKLRGVKNAQMLATGLQGLFDATQINNRNYQPLTQAPAEGVLNTVDQIAQNNKVYEQGFQNYLGDSFDYNSQVADVFNSQVSMDVNEQLQELQKEYEEKLEETRDIKKREQLGKEYQVMNSLIRTGNLDMAKSFAEDHGIKFPDVKGKGKRERTGSGVDPKVDIGMELLYQKVDKTKDKDGETVFHFMDGKPSSLAANILMNGSEEDKRRYAIMEFNKKTLEYRDDFRESLKTGDKEKIKNSANAFVQFLKRAGYSEEHIRQALEGFRPANTGSGQEGQSNAGNIGGQQQGQGQQQAGNSGQQQPTQVQDNTAPASATVNPTKLQLPDDLSDSLKRQAEKLTRTIDAQRVRLEKQIANGNKTGANATKVTIKRLENSLRDIAEQHSK